MLSHTGRRNLFGTLTNNTTTANLTTADTLINASEKRILTMRAWPFLEKKDTSLTTTASTQFYELPQKVSKVKAVTITVGSRIYTPKEVTSEVMWNKLNESSYSSNYPEYFYIRAGQIGFYPTPSTSSLTITLYYRQVPKDLTVADYTTGTVTTLAAAGTTVTGSGTTWTAKMAGRYIRLTDSNTANTGDGFWYEIASVASATSLTLTKPYAGTAISAGSASYTIGQMSLLPEGYHELPVYDSLRTYFASIEINTEKAQMYDRMTKEMLAQLIQDFGNKTEGITLNDGMRHPVTNPNLFISY